MTRLLLSGLGLAALLTVWLPSPASDDDWTSLFNGEDLSGWTVKSVAKDQGKDFWRVEDGAILCDAIGRPDHDYVWLVSDAEYGDFELRLRFQAFRDSPGNSGVQIRSRYDDSPDAPQGGWLDGPQVDVHPPFPWRTGLVYDETREERRWIAPSMKDWVIPDDYPRQDPPFFFADEGDGWNELYILAQGTRIRTELNGHLMTDYDGAGVLDSAAHLARNVGLHGHIALQLHSNDELRIRYKDLRLRVLAP